MTSRVWSTVAFAAWSAGVGATFVAEYAVALHYAPGAAARRGYIPEAFGAVVMTAKAVMWPWQALILAGNEIGYYATRSGSRHPSAWQCHTETVQRMRYFGLE